MTEFRNISSMIILLCCFSLGFFGVDVLDRLVGFTGSICCILLGFKPEKSKP